MNKNLEEKISILGRIREKVKGSGMTYIAAGLLALSVGYAGGCGESACCEELECNSGYSCDDVSKSDKGKTGVNCIYDESGEAIGCCKCEKDEYEYNGKY